MKVELTLEEMREITEVLSQVLDRAENDVEKAKEIVRADFAEMGKTLHQSHVIFWAIDTLAGLRAERAEKKAPAARQRQQEQTKNNSHP